MSTEHVFDDKGKVKPKPATKQGEPEKQPGSLTADQVRGQLDAGTLTQMQQTMGNSAVQRFLAQRSEAGPTELDDETAGAINQERGGGQQMDAGMADRAGSVMRQDFSDVKVHTGPQADQLNEQLGAKAFTTGNDIFFREGAYDPGSSEGQQLISHELTHVAQQRGGEVSHSGGMTVNDPNDQYEAEADQVANSVMSQPSETAAASAETVQRQEEEELTAQEEEEEVQAQEMEEDEEELAAE